MRHLAFFVHILSFMIGCVSIILSYIAYAKSQNRLYKYYMYFLISFMAVIAERTVAFYKLASVFETGYADVILWVISCLGSGLLMYSLPLFIHELLDLELTTRKRTLFHMLAYMPIIALVLYYTLPYKITVLTVISTIVFVVLIYCLCLTAVNLKNVKAPEIKSIIKTFLIILGVWIPILIVDSKTEQIAFLQRLFPYGLMSIPLFYVIWNSFSMYYGFKYILPELLLANDNGKPGQDKHIRTDFFEKYKITGREKEVILLLAQGHSYNKISQELMISLTTVRTHIYNVYQKTGASNKIELINLMKTL